MPMDNEAMKQQERAVIEKFFREKVPQGLKSRNLSELQSSCTEASCVSFAKVLLNTNDIDVVDNQGSNSFTVINPSQAAIVQFRLVPLDIRTMNLAHKIHGDLVPEIEFIDTFILPVYKSKVIPGRVHFLQPFPKDEFPLQREKVTVAELGKFVAQSAWTELPGQLTDSSWTATAQDTFDRLLNNSSLKTLAPELVELIATIRLELHLLDVLPTVLTHNDFAQINILVDDLGHVTGVIDFEDARPEAFGMCIWGLYECFFGSMEDGKWRFYDMPGAIKSSSTSGESVREVLESIFWESLWSNVPPRFERQGREMAVKVALSVGVIRRYFIRGMLDQIDMSLKVHRLSLEYARGILPAVWKGS